MRKQRECIKKKEEKSRQTHVLLPVQQRNSRVFRSLGQLKTLPMKRLIEQPAGIIPVLYMYLYNVFCSLLGE